MSTLPHERYRVQCSLCGILPDAHESRAVAEQARKNHATFGKCALVYDYQVFIVPVRTRGVATR